MRIAKLFSMLLLVGLTRAASAQELPPEVGAALKSDDTTALVSFVTKDNVNACYGNYSLLSQTVRENAKKCFDFMIAHGANVNLSCNSYVPPLMHAAKYGRLEMAKVLVAKGADIKYTYNGDYEPAKGMTPLSYAEKFQQKEVADFLKSLPTK